MKAKRSRPLVKRLAPAVGLILMLLDVFYSSTAWDPEASWRVFDYHLLPCAIPDVTLYLILALWLFPRYVKAHHIKKYVFYSLGIIVCLSFIWAFFGIPNMPESATEKKWAKYTDEVIFLDDAGQQKFMNWIDTEDLCSECVLDSCRNYTHEVQEAHRSRISAIRPYWLTLRCFLWFSGIFVVFSTIYLLAYAIEGERARRELAAERSAAELTLLKYQLNPHFLMNTLNNIHALIEIDSEKAQESVQLLSKMMRYMLNEAAQEHVELFKEVDFMNTYFAIMRERFIDEVDIQFNVPAPVPRVKVAPAIFLNLAENAFKHGVSYEGNSFIHFSLSVDEDMICCEVVNSKPQSTKNVQSTGYGLEGLRKRLDFIYPNEYVYNVEETDSQYRVTLKIPAK